MKNSKNVLARSYSLTRGGSNLLLILGMFVLFYGCGKECLEKPVVEENAFFDESNLIPSCEDACDECGDLCYPNSVLDAIKDPENAGNDRINMILYHYGVAVKEAMKNPAHKQLILTTLVTKPEEAISFLELAQENAAFADFFNDQLRQSMSDKNIYPKGVELGVETLIATPGWDANSYLTERMIHEGYTYDPVIYEMKDVSTVNQNLVTILIAQEVNDCDDVAGWTADGEVLVSETQATESADLILFVAPGKPVALPGSEDIRQKNQEEVFAVVELDAPEEELAEERSATVSFEIRAVSGKIKGSNYRYEGSNKSDIVAFVIGWESDPSRPKVISNKDAYTKFKKCDIKDQKTVTINRNIGGIIDNALNSNVFIGFYEYDWYISGRNLKKVKCPCNASISDAELSMKYAHEWYNTDLFCGSVATLIPTSTGSKTLDNYKGTFVLKRQPL